MRKQVWGIDLHIQFTASELVKMCVRRSCFVGFFFSPVDLILVVTGL